MKRITLAPRFLLLSLLACACSSPAAQHETAAAPAKSAMSDKGQAVPASAGLEGSQRAAPARGPALGGDSDAALVAELIRLSDKDNRVDEHLRHLCLAIGPRLTSSHNLAKAQQWALEQFTAWGLDARLEKWGEFPVGFDRGPFHGGIVGARPLEFEFTTMAWTPGTQGAKRGPALFKPETEEQLAAVADKLAGAWLVTRSYPRGSERPKVDKETKDKISAAIEAAGIAGEIRSAGRDLVITDGNYRITWDKLPKLVKVVVRGSHYDELVTRMGQDEPVEVEFDIDNRFYEGPVPQYNVIADIKGSEFPDEYVIVGGHLDSWDGAQGTVDNGTGSATTLEVARLLMASGARPKRTIRFALWSGEEQGLFGSEGYVRDHKDELDRISAVYIHDGGTNYLSGLGVTYDMEAQMRQVCAPLIGLNPEMPFALRVHEGFQYSPDSDHAPFAGLGVPGFFWDQAGKSDYNHMHHTQYDTLDSAVPEYQKHSALVASIAAYKTANLPELLNRENFKAMPPRRMGVNLDGTKLGSVSKGGKAAEAGWQVGDVVVSIDGVMIQTRDQVTEVLQQGGPRKVVVVRRGEEQIETVIDYSNDKEEAERARRAAARQAKSSAEQKKFW